MNPKELSLEEIERIKQVTEKGNAGEYFGGIPTFICPICNKRFSIMDMGAWIFKRRRFWKAKGNNKTTVINYFCSYGCTSKYDSIFNR